MKKPRIAILGATGVVGREITKITEELDVEFESIKFLSSAKSAGSKVNFKGKEYTVEEATPDVFENVDIELAEKGYPLVPKRWGDTTVATVAYGYGISVSPLHVISAYSAVINGGIYHSPSILKNSPKAQNGHRVISFSTSSMVLASET